MAEKAVQLCLSRCLTQFTRVLASFCVPYTWSLAVEHYKDHRGRLRHGLFRHLFVCCDVCMKFAYVSCLDHWVSTTSGTLRRWLAAECHRLIPLYQISRSAAEQDRVLTFMRRAYTATSLVAYTALTACLTSCT